MPRRIVGSANYDLYASLTPRTKPIFLRLFADIIHKVVDAELSGDLRRTGIDSDFSKRCNYLLRARIMLTDDTIVVRATSFSGPDTEDDDNDRNDDHDICEFEFERDRGQWRLVQIFGNPLPVPDLVNRAVAPKPNQSPPAQVPITVGITSRLSSNVTSKLRTLIASTAPNLPSVDLVTRMTRAKPKLRIFISYARTHHFAQPPNRAQQLTRTAPVPRPEIEIQTETKVAIIILNCLHNVIRGKIKASDSIWPKTHNTIMSLIQMETSLLGRINNARLGNEQLAFEITEALRASPARAEDLLFNLAELAVNKSSTLMLRQSNLATWKTLIVHPLNSACNNPRKSNTFKKQNSHTIVTRHAGLTATRRKAVASNLRVRAKTTDTPRDQNSRDE